MTRRQSWTVAVLAVLAAAFAAVFSERHGLFDLKVYYGAIDYWVHGGGLYDYLKPFSTYGFTYPTFAALTMLPMALLPWPAAAVVSVLLTAAATALVLWWLVVPLARRLGWPHRFAYAVALCLAIAYEPMRETVNFGQVNMLLLALVAADLLVLLPRRAGGVLVGLATAIKLTPGIFIVYLLLTKRWRAAVVASATATVATLVAAAVAPDASREFWTAALWDTDRVGRLDFISNQSLQGVVARLDPLHPSRLAWLVLVVVVLGVWAWRVRRAEGDVRAGLALTGVAGCLLSPVTWVHHLVWLIPALVLLVGAGWRRRALAVFLYGVLCSRLVWLWYEKDASGPLAFVLANAYVWASVALLLAIPVGTRSAERDGVADLGERAGVGLGA